MTIRLGYACINMHLQKTQKITTNRGMIKRTFKAKGISYASELAEHNTRNLLPILMWNHKNNIKVFRMTSCLFPWASEYELEDLPHWDQIQINLKKVGAYAKHCGIRLSFHPGPFNILTSPKEHVVANSIKDLDTHGKIMDTIGMARDRWSKINIHIGATYGDKQSAIDRWCKNYERLPESVKTRITLENDDKASMYSTKDLYQVYERLGVPIVFDYHHHKFCTGDQTEEEALKLAASTWGDVRPCCHYSESKALNEGLNVKPQAHSDYIFQEVQDYGLDIDVVFEAKAKEQAILKYREIYGDKQCQLLAK
jgi:UV DNA damage endonuclease